MEGEEVYAKEVWVWCDSKGFAPNIEKESKLILQRFSALWKQEEACCWTKPRIQLQEDHFYGMINRGKFFASCPWGLLLSVCISRAILLLFQTELQDSISSLVEDLKMLWKHWPLFFKKNKPAFMRKTTILHFVHMCACECMCCNLKEVSLSEKNHEWCE